MKPILRIRESDAYLPITTAQSKAQIEELKSTLIPNIELVGVES